MLTADDAAARRGVLDRHHAELDRRIARAQQSKSLVEHALACPAEDFMHCPEFERLVHDLDPARHGRAADRAG
ncbi:hypothetical protein [Micromonospora sp. NPDC049679]|uniref:hypothetical protein n=1 Tax=Micromonospora sp. NPDC049679 TaxID=3155920 RepID=UPI0033D0A513